MSRARSLNQSQSAQELRWKIVNYGYDFFLKTKKLTWVNTTETPEDWRKKMSDPNEWGDDVALQLASNVLRVDIVLITAFHESAVHKDLGLTIINSQEKSNPEPLYLFYYSESDFSSAHFQSIFPRYADNVVKTYLTSLAPSLTEESLQDIPIVLDSQYSQLEISNEPFQSTRVVISSSVGENPVSLMAQEVVPRKRGRPRGSKNKKKPETSRPSCPEVGTQGGAWRSRSRKR